MPSKNVVRNFAPDVYYHVFNRGVEKRIIFLDTEDYQIFLYYLRVYLLPLEKLLILYPDLPLRFYAKNMSEEVKLISYCLMPNHFHFLLLQNTSNGTSRFIKRLTNAYTQYFNQKYHRVGGLMQGRFKAIAVESDAYLLQLSRYIHLNPIVGNLTQNLKDYQWSSYGEYSTKRSLQLCSTKIVLDFFKSTKGYEQFVLDQISYIREIQQIENLLLED